jgi:type III secretion protein L
MVVWFKNGSCTVGVEDGLVRAGDFASLTSLLDAAASVEESAKRLLADAAVKAEQLIADAQARFDTAHQQGVAQGEQEGLRQWSARALRGAAGVQQALEKQNVRLGRIVSLAVERIVAQEDKEALYKRAIQAVNHIVKEVPLLTLRVSPGDHAAAQKAVEASAEDGRSLPIEVVADTTLALGSCVFESDQGVIDAGLETQLAAIQRAVQRASQQMPETADAAESHDDVEADAEPAADADTDAAADAYVQPEADVDTEVEVEVEVETEASADIEALAPMEIDTQADDEVPNGEVDATAPSDDPVTASPMQAA